MDLEWSYFVNQSTLLKCKLHVKGHVLNLDFVSKFMVPDIDFRTFRQGSKKFS